MGYNQGGHYTKDMTQNREEITALANLFIQENVRSFLEIGSRFGGSLWFIARQLPVGSRIVSVDSGEGHGGHKPNQMQSLQECIMALQGFGYDAHLINGWSHAESTIRQARELGPYDAVFIDGDHYYDAVSKDWKNYGSMARIVALHDIAWEMKPHFPATTKVVEVPKFWRELEVRAREFNGMQRYMGKDSNMGIGVVWR